MTRFKKVTVAALIAGFLAAFIPLAASTYKYAPEMQSGPVDIIQMMMRRKIFPSSKLPIWFEISISAFVMAGLVPPIHALFHGCNGVDARYKAGHGIGQLWQILSLSRCAKPRLVTRTAARK